MIPLGMRMSSSAMHAIDRYAPNSAFEVTVSDGDAISFYLTKLSGRASATVFWGDGTKSEYSTKSTATATHEYSAGGVYVVQISDDIGRFYIQGWNHFSEWVTRPLRWGDSVTSAEYAYYGCRGIAYPPIRWTDKIANAASAYQECRNMPGPIPPWGRSITRANSCYSDCMVLTGTVPEWTDAMENASYVYYNDQKITGTIPQWGQNITAANRTFHTCYGLRGTIPPWNDKVTDVSSCYGYNGALTGSVPAWGKSITVAENTFRRCRGLTGDIPAWPSGLVNAEGTFRECTGLNGAWTEDADALMPESVTNHTNTFTDASDELRSLFYTDWGGTKTRPSTGTE